MEFWRESLFPEEIYVKLKDWSKDLVVLLSEIKYGFSSDMQSLFIKKIVRNSLNAAFALLHYCWRVFP